MFSERSEPISELVKGKPEKPLREPTLALFACLLNLYQILQLSTQLSRLGAQVLPSPPFGSIYPLVQAIMIGLIDFTIAFTILLAFGAATTYFINRRVGGAILLVSSIFGLLVSFVGIVGVLVSFSVLGLIVSFLSPIFGLLAGVWGIRGEKPTSREATQEII